MNAPRREAIFDFICGFFDEKGHAPTVYEIGDHFAISHVGAWKHVKELVADGRLQKIARRIVITGRVDLRPVSTDKLQAELARRRAVRHAEASR